MKRIIPHGTVDDFILVDVRMRLKKRMQNWPIYNQKM